MTADPSGAGTIRERLLALMADFEQVAGMEDLAALLREAAAALPLDGSEAQGIAAQLEAVQTNWSASMRHTCSTEGVTDYDVLTAAVKALRG